MYARGFVHEVARCLNLDPTQVTRTYLKRFREWLTAEMAKAVAEQDGGWASQGRVPAQVERSLAS